MRHCTHDKLIARRYTSYGHARIRRNMAESGARATCGPSQQAAEAVGSIFQPHHIEPGVRFHHARLTETLHRRVWGDERPPGLVPPAGCDDEPDEADLPEAVVQGVVHARWKGLQSRDRAAAVAEGVPGPRPKLCPSVARAVPDERRTYQTLPTIEHTRALS